jgi:hypothetical protein
MPKPKKPMTESHNSQSFKRDGILSSFVLHIGTTNDNNLSIVSVKRAAAIAQRIPFSWYCTYRTEWLSEKCPSSVTERAPIDPLVQLE